MVGGLTYLKVVDRLPEMPQQDLALELRYAVDVARKTRRFSDVDRVAWLIDQNPHNVRSKHVAHNLGKDRINWLRNTIWRANDVWPS